MAPFLILLLAAGLTWVILKLHVAQRLLEELDARLRRLESTRERSAREEAATAAATTAPPPLPVEPIEAPPPLKSFAAAESQAAAESPAPPPLIDVPGLAAPSPVLAQPTGTAETIPDEGSTGAPGRLEPGRAIVPAINWETFLGVKLFAWLGGLALFLGVVFFVKYSFEHNLISPQTRLAIGYLVGAGLVAGGLCLPRARHLVTVQTLCATGILVLYANSFAAHAYYHFLGAPATFALMILVTAAAFVLAVRLVAQVIAVLGLLGGFLTPWLHSTGVDHAGVLFGYLALLDAGLIAVLLRQRWNHLGLLAAVATLLMQFGWVFQFFQEDKINIAMAIFLGFAALFVGAVGIAHRLKQVDKWISSAGLLMPAAALLFALYLLAHPYPALAQRVWWLFGFVFLADSGFLILAWLRDELRPATLGGGAVVFLLLATWTAQFLTPALLDAALVFYLLFAALHAVYPLVQERLRPASMPLWPIHLYPSLALLLILVPLFKIAGPSFLIWPVVLLIDLIAMVLAVLTASLASILVVFLLTVLGTAAWIFQLPAELPAVPGMLAVIGGFAIFFMLGAVFAARKVFRIWPAGRGEDNRLAAGATGATGTAASALTPQMFSQVMALAAMLPFLLLTLVVLRLPLTNPSPVLGLAALLVLLLLGVTKLCRVDGLAVVGLLSALLVEYGWHAHRFTPQAFAIAVGWYLGFAAMFFVFPFVFQNQMRRRVVPWAASALAFPLHFLLVYRSCTARFPDFDYPGLWPAALALPCLAGLLRLARTVPEEREDRLTLLAWFGGATLFFITLVFPIQFERQWITISWALEGAALLWLFGRVPHPGLRLVGVVLLVASFARLVLNPWVILEYGRSGKPILNWYLYAYGIVTVCLMAGAHLLAPPRNQMLGGNAPPLLYGLGTVLAFALVNLEIADYFSASGQPLEFHFSANLAQDMTYSLAWALFAFALLAVGFKVNNAATRYAGMGLLVITLFKLFLHDLWKQGGLYRIGSLVGLAVVLILVSFIYQRFLSSEAARSKQ